MLKQWYSIVKNWDGGLLSSVSVFMAIGGFLGLIIMPSSILFLNLFLYILNDSLAASWGGMILAFFCMVALYAIVLLAAIIYDYYYSKNLV